MNYELPYQYRLFRILYIRAVATSLGFHLHLFAPFAVVVAVLGGRVSILTPFVQYIRYSSDSNRRENTCSSSASKNVHDESEYRASECNMYCPHGREGTSCLAHTSILIDFLMNFVTIGPTARLLSPVCKSQGRLSVTRKPPRGLQEAKKSARNRKVPPKRHQRLSVAYLRLQSVFLPSGVDNQWFGYYIIDKYTLQCFSTLL